MKYEVSNIGKVAVVILNMVQNLCNNWILSPRKILHGAQQAENDKTTGTTHIAYSIFHISSLNGEYK